MNFFIALSLLTSVFFSQGVKGTVYGIKTDYWFHWMGGGLISLGCAKKGIPEKSDKVYFLLTVGKEIADVAIGGKFDPVEIGIGYLGKKVFDYL